MPKTITFNPLMPTVTIWVQLYSVSQKKSPAIFWHFLPNGSEFLINFLRTYDTILSTLDYKFLFNYFQLWRSYAILRVTTQRIFTFHFYF